MAHCKTKLKSETIDEIAVAIDVFCNPAPLRINLVSCTLIACSHIEEAERHLRTRLIQPNIPIRAHKFNNSRMLFVCYSCLFQNVHMYVYVVVVGCCWFVIVVVVDCVLCVCCFVFCGLWFVACHLLLVVG